VQPADQSEVIPIAPRPAPRPGRRMEPKRTTAPRLTRPLPHGTGHMGIRRADGRGRPPCTELRPVNDQARALAGGQVMKANFLPRLGRGLHEGMDTRTARSRVVFRLWLSGHLPQRSPSHEPPHPIPTQHADKIRVDLFAGGAEPVPARKWPPHGPLISPSTTATTPSACTSINHPHTRKFTCDVTKSNPLGRSPWAQVAHRTPAPTAPTTSQAAGANRVYRQPVHFVVICM